MAPSTKQAHDGHVERRSTKPLTPTNGAVPAVPEQAVAKRSRGGQPGNGNANKAGVYSRNGRAVRRKPRDMTEQERASIRRRNDRARKFAAKRLGQIADLREERGMPELGDLEHERVRGKLVLLKSAMEDIEALDVANVAAGEVLRRVTEKRQARDAIDRLDNQVWALAELDGPSGTDSAQGALDRARYGNGGAP